MKTEEKKTKPLSTLFYNMLALKSRRRVRPLIYAYIGALTPPCLPRRGSNAAGLRSVPFPFVSLSAGPFIGERISSVSLTNQHRRFLVGGTSLHLCHLLSLAARFRWFSHF
ncbi:Peptidyl-prolyl cis-trans isomerase-like [Trichinella spiralis]|uniref:Peptidyl-prolyl cis-trans isomerase-like n=1 Tax=Trichinella spiralis TaxID=6334 RepID=A0ABR3K260_TRISP